MLFSWRSSEWLPGVFVVREDLLLPLTCADVHRGTSQKIIREHCMRGDFCLFTGKWRLEVRAVARPQMAESSHHFLQQVRPQGLKGAAELQRGALRRKHMTQNGPS